MGRVCHAVRRLYKRAVVKLTMPHRVVFGTLDRVQQVLAAHDW